MSRSTNAALVQLGRYRNRRSFTAADSVESDEFKAKTMETVWDAFHANEVKVTKFETPAWWKTLEREELEEVRAEAEQNLNKLLGKGNWALFGDRLFYVVAEATSRRWAADKVLDRAAPPPMRSEKSMNRSYVLRRIDPNTVAMDEVATPAVAPVAAPPDGEF